MRKRELCIIPLGYFIYLNDNEVIKLFHEEENDLEYIRLLSYILAFGLVSGFFNNCKLYFQLLFTQKSYKVINLKK